MVIVGGGFAGIRVTRALPRSDVDITIVDRTNHHLFHWSLAEATPTSSGALCLRYDLIRPAAGR